MKAAPKVLITGGNGFLGRNLSDYFKARGYEVSVLVRDVKRYPFREKGVRIFEGNLPDKIDSKAFDGAQSVIHCAYTTQVASAHETDRVNRGGTERVLELSRKAGVKKFVFISSTGATPEAESRYGKSKYELEKLMDPERELVIRPGLIIGPGKDGSFNRMKGSVAGLGVVPLFGGGGQILQTVYIDDLCQAILNGIDKNLTGVLVVAEEEGMTIKEFFNELARLMGKKCFFVPLPLSFSLGILKIIESLKLPFPLSSENLLGLKHMVHMPSKAYADKIGFKMRSARESLRISI